MIDDNNPFSFVYSWKSVCVKSRFRSERRATFETRCECFQCCNAVRILNLLLLLRHWHQWTKKMTTNPPTNQKITVKVTENVAKILRDKDKVIKLQAKRIEVLEREVDKLRKERDSLNTKVTLLSCKLQATSNPVVHAASVDSRLVGT